MRDGGVGRAGPGWLCLKCALGRSERSEALDCASSQTTSAEWSQHIIAKRENATYVLPLWTGCSPGSCGHLDTQKPLNFSSDCIPDESTLSFVLCILERLKWLHTVQFPSLQPNQIHSHSKAQVLTFPFCSGAVAHGMGVLPGSPPSSLLRKCSLEQILFVQELSVLLWGFFLCFTLNHLDLY